MNRPKAVRLDPYGPDDRELWMSPQAHDDSDLDAKLGTRLAGAEQPRNPVLPEPSKAFLPAGAKPLCADDPEVFEYNPRKTLATERAIRLCRACPVLQQCRAIACDPSLPDDLWLILGGLRPNERVISKWDLRQKELAG